MAGRGFYINFKVPELQTVLNNMHKYDTKTAVKIEEAVQTSTRAIRNGAVRRIHSVSGYMKKHTVSSFNKQKVEGAIRAKAPHAHLVEFGAKAATVGPGASKSKKSGKPTQALTIDEFGNRNYAQKAHIPQRRERPFMRPAFEDEKPNLIRNLAEAVKKP